MIPLGDDSLNSLSFLAIAFVGLSIGNVLSSRERIEQAAKAAGAAAE